jgi:hypothetical protein
MLLRITILSLFSVLLTGCNSQLNQVIKNIDKLRGQGSVIPDRMRENAIKVLRYGDYYMKEYSNEYSGSIPSSNETPLKIGESLMLQEMNIFDSDTAKTLPMISEKEGEFIKKCNASASNYTLSYVRINLKLDSYLHLQRLIEWKADSDSYFNSDTPPPSPLINNGYSEFQKTWEETLQFREQMIKDCYL